jgi:hypothetical protein
VIVMNTAYLENRLGPAKYKDDPYWTFEVGRCEIIYNVDGGKVQGYEFKLRRSCASRIRGYGDLQGMVLRPGVTFGDVEKLNLWQTEFSADCLTGCGNAADRWAYMDALGSRSGGPYAIHFGVDIEEHPALEAADEWEKALKAKYRIRGDYLPPEASECGDRLSKVAARVFARSPIQSVALGDYSAMVATDCSKLDIEVGAARASDE